MAQAVSDHGRARRPLTDGPITEDDAGYALDLVRKVCTEVGPGLPGSPQERERAAVIKKELESHLGDGSVVTEEFTVAPNAFIGSLILSGLFTVVAALFYTSTGSVLGLPSWATVASALAFSAIPLVLFVAGFLFNFDFMDRFFGKGQSVNVVGTLRRPGTTTVKRLLILSGHHDSAWENNWLRLPGYGFFIATVTLLAGLVTMPAMAAIQFVAVLAHDAGLVHPGTLGWVLLAYPVLPSAVLLLLYNTSRKDGGSVPGAADNLSACAVVAATCRSLARNPECIPADTEIRFVTFGSEEAGLRGSKSYVRRHLDELKRLDARVLNLEIVAHSEVGILTSEVNGTVKNSPEMVESVAAAAERAQVPFRLKSAFLGVASDAGSFSRAGIMATTLLCFKVPQQMLSFYHQRRDGPDVLSSEPLLNALRVSFQWIRSGGTR